MIAILDVSRAIARKRPAEKGKRTVEEHDQDALDAIRDQVAQFMANISELSLPLDIELQIAVKIAELESELKKDNLDIEAVKAIVDSVSGLAKGA